MKIAIIGAGALGCLFGGRLAAADHDVWLLHHREGPARQLAQHGVRITGGSAPVTVDVSATTDAADVGAADLVVVLVRAHQTPTALDDHTACIGPDTLLLSLQNGLRTEEHLREHVAASQALYGVTYEAAVRDEPGLIHHSSAGETVIGGATADAQVTVQEALEPAGFAMTLTDHPQQTIWQKGLLVSATSPVLTLTGCSVADLMADPLRTLVEQLLTEAIQVATDRGIDIDPDPIRETLNQMADTHSSHEVSMSQDIERGRTTEIGELNGAIIEYGEEAAISTPVNRTVTALVRGLENHP